MTTPTFEEYMVVNGMNDPYHLRADLLEKWKVKYALVFKIPAAAPPVVNPPDVLHAPADAEQKAAVQ